MNNLHNQHHLAGGNFAHPQFFNQHGNQGKRKMNNDPNRPKRPTSAYFYFVQLEREEAAKRGERINRVADWTKQVSAKWRTLTNEQKEQFQVLAAGDKVRYSQQMAVYTGKDANRPKRPQSAYFLWLADFRVRVKDKFAEHKDILRAAGEEWRKMTMDDKAPYEQLAEEERKKYDIKIKEYNQVMMTMMMMVNVIMMVVMMTE
ncbi:hypothetical protein HELRODRAFT_87165 [Helobdella robusta]|uniref:Transcription factor A, mitochondrial n=1 Tax=Helobdella robusta TaxID=6412 RepID=T1G6M6_HELRO|nr:hypothetical protein HELRODRAFT_87165 [Helobdella robusta]ESN95104.1 hypothetical protein HELRODRAFT_87165 [Helobdella robusta]